MPKVTGEWRVRLIHAVIDFIYEDDPKDMMAAIFTFFKCFWGSKDEVIQVATIEYLSDKNLKKRQKEYKDCFVLLMKSVFHEKGMITFDSDASFMIVGDKLSSWEIKDEFRYLDVIIRIYNKDSDKLEITSKKETKAPWFIKKFFDELSFFSIDTINNCAECGHYFFEERGYNRKFCSVKCKNRFGVRKSRAKAKKEEGDK